MEKYLVIGLGSMGKRRVRCLLALGKTKEQIMGVDLREDRRIEAEKLYGVKTFDTVENMPFDDICAVIVSLPPDKHYLGAKVAIDNDKPVFLEASVLYEDVKKIIDYNQNKVFVAPSYTFTFHSLLKEVANIIESQKYGKICNFSYHSGQYLPDWHPWESVNDFYVGNRLTGGAREIVPFELTWMTHFLGMPKGIKGYFRKTMDIGCDIEDSYVCCIDYGTFIGNMVVDVVSRYAVRNLIINFERGQIQWNWDEKRIKVYDSADQTWTYIEQPTIKHEANYNENIDENMYIEEISTFLKGIKDRKIYENTLEKDLKVLQLLNELETSDGGFAR